MSTKAAVNLAFACDCGALHGHIAAEGVRTGTHVVCFCADCRAAELYLGQPDPAPGPVDIFQISPDAIKIAQGEQNLAAIRLSPKGMYRWYASCCNAPIATSMTSAKRPFAGFSVRRISDADKLGPVVTKASAPVEGGKSKHENLAPAVFGLLRRMISARLSGRWRQTPFFDPNTNQPVVEPKVLTLPERKALYT